MIELDRGWRTRTAVVIDAAGRRLDLDADGAGLWRINGTHDPRLDGCLDLDLEASAVTNTAPVHRLALAIGASGTSAAAYVRTNTLALERLDQTYRRLPDDGGALIFEYAAPRFGYHDRLRFASDGLVIDYPLIGARVRVHPSTDPV